MPLFGGKKVDKAKLEEKMRIENHLTSLSGGGSLADLSLLTHLNLASNKLTELPKNIGECLTSLKSLCVRDNRLKQLPESLAKLKNLERLIASDNKLQSVPECLSEVNALRELDLRGNSLKQVPVAFSKLRYLRNFYLGGNSGLFFPPQLIVDEGTAAIMQFLCEKAGIPYENPGEDDAEDLAGLGLSVPVEDISRRRSCHDAIFEAEQQAVEHDKRQRQRQRQMLETEERLRETARLEEEARSASLAKSKLIMTQLAEENRALEDRIKRVQVQKDREREVMLRQITDVEHHSNELIVNLIAVNDSNRKADADAVLDGMLQTRLQLDDFDKLRRREILEKMESHLSDILEKESMALSEHARLANEVVKTALEQDVASDEKVMEMMKTRSGEREKLIKKIMTDEDMQRQMLLSLLMERDTHRVAISAQVGKILEQLALLSQAEAKQRDLRGDTQASALESKRVMLSELLSALIVQKQEREAELAKRLKEMEEQRQEQQEGYWLMQYQRLLDGAPEALKDAQVEMDWVLKDILLRVGAQKYVPHFARRRLTADDCVDYDKRDFQMLGIKDESLISLLMTEFSEYKEEQRKAHLKVAAGVDKLSEPSAPPLDLGKAAPSAGSDAVAVVRGEEAFVPSAPPAALTARIEEECVVCMENKCEMVFLACGHVCCCKKCADPLTLCPLCRATIATRILLLNTNT